MTVNLKKKIKDVIEAKFMSPEKINNLSVVTDSNNNRLYFGFTPSGNKVSIIHIENNTPLITEYCKSGSKIYHLQSDSSNLPAMHKVLSNGSEIFYLFNKKMQLIKVVQNYIGKNKKICKFTNSAS